MPLRLPKFLQLQWLLGIASMPHAAVVALAGLGGIVLLRFAYSVLCYFYGSFIRTGPNPKKLGAWAVVTGATDGIGKALAKKLAARGLNIVLVSRTPQRLQDTAKEIKDKYPSVEIKQVPFDFAKASPTDFDRLQKELKELDIGVLYNNVGVSYDTATSLEEVAEEKIEALLEVNNRSMVKVTRMVLPGMLSRKKGAIINIGSFAGSSADPFYAVYSASKAFVEMFSKSLALELKGKGVTCQNHIPLFVATKMAIPNEKRRKPTLFTPHPEQWASASINSIGGDSSVLPYWAHRLQAAVIFSLPEWLWDMVHYSMNADIRKKALKKRTEGGTDSTKKE